MTNVEIMSRLVKNAIDFLRQSNLDFNDKPKLSVINFYAAVELMLKTRLFAEHWTLVANKQTTRRRFEEGDFQSVSFEEAVQRLRDIVGTSISEDAFRSFDAVRRHRNKMLHFFHAGDEAVLVKIATEQLQAWYYLNQLLTTTWRATFAPYAADIEAIERSLHAQREYLRAKFMDLAPRLSKLCDNGTTILDCRACGFKSAEAEELLKGLFHEACLVCGARRAWLQVECVCGELGEYEGEAEPFSCSKCNTSESAESLVERLNEETYMPDEASFAMTPAACGDCDSYQTVVERDGRYVCLQCFEVTDTLDQCEWCSDYSTGDMSDSYLMGCGMCDGHAGWHRDD